jgi:hypothetical protein
VRAIGVLAAVIGGLLLGASAPAYASVSAGTSAITVGPMQINPVGHPGLCWQATGNGAPIELETCRASLQNQQWSLNPNGVLINGIGYCLEALPSKPHGTPLYIDFASQCGGTHGQVWTYNGKGQLTSAGNCAAVDGKLEAGAQIVRASCPRGPRWSLGYSAVTLAAGTGSGPAGGSFSASVTVANAASAQGAYGTAVAFGLPKTLIASVIKGSGDAASFRCNVQTATCTGTLPAGASGRITVSGRVPDGAVQGDSYTLTAKTTVAGTSQQAGAKHATASVKVLVGAAAPAPASEGKFVPLSMPLLALIVGLLILGGGLLVGVAARRRPSRKLRPLESSRAFDDTRPYELPQIYAPRRPHDGQRPYDPRPSEEPGPSDAPSSYQIPRPSEEPQPSEAPSSYEVLRPAEAPRLYEAPRSYEVPRPSEESRPADALSSYEAPRRYDDLRPYEGQRAYDDPRSCEDQRFYEDARAYEGQLSYESPRAYKGSPASGESRPDEGARTYEGRRRRSDPDPISGPQPVGRSGRHAAHR